MDDQVDILIGLKCNQKCKFCFQEDERILSKDSVPDFGNILKTLIKGRKLGLTRVNIAGGEATIYEELYKTLSLSKQLGYKQIKLVTNGMNLKNFEYAEKIIPFLDDIAISLHASDEAIHDELTKVKGSYKSVLEAIENIKKIKPEIQLINHIVINSLNFEHLEKHMENLISLGFTRVDFLNMMPNTSINRDLYIPTEILAKIIIRIIDKYADKIMIEVCYTQPCFYEGYEKYISGFDLGRDFLSNRKDVLINWKKTLLEYKKTEDKCLDCKYYKECMGFWDQEKINSNNIK